MSKRTRDHVQRNELRHHVAASLYHRATCSSSPHLTLLPKTNKVTLPKGQKHPRDVTKLPIIINRHCRPGDPGETTQKGSYPIIIIRSPASWSKSIASFMKVTVFVIAAVFSLAHGNPVPQTTGSCGAFENYNPYTDQCVQYASPSSCGLLGIACDSGEWCSNAQNLNAPGGILFPIVKC